MITRAHFILFVTDQPRATAFYRQVLDLEPVLDVPGMTELALPGGAVLGLMPAQGAARLFRGAIDPNRVGDEARAELYLVVDDPKAHLDRAVSAGARLLSAPLERDWGHVVGYVADLDGYVIGFACPVS